MSSRDWPKKMRGQFPVPSALCVGGGLNTRGPRKCHETNPDIPATDRQNYELLSYACVQCRNFYWHSLE